MPHSAFPRHNENCVGARRVVHRGCVENPASVRGFELFTAILDLFECHEKNCFASLFAVYSILPNYRGFN